MDNTTSAETSDPFLAKLDEVITSFCHTVALVEAEIIAWSEQGFISRYNQAVTYQKSVSAGLDVGAKYPHIDQEVLLQLEKRNLEGCRKLSDLKESATKLLGITWKEA